MSTERIQELVNMLLYRGKFEIKGKFKDLTSDLRHIIMSHYQADFIIMVDGVDRNLEFNINRGQNFFRRKYYSKLNDTLDIHIGSIDLEENDDDCRITVNSDMLMVLGTSLNDAQGTLQIGKIFSKVLRQFKVELLNEIRSKKFQTHHYLQAGFVADWQYSFTIPFKDFRYHIIVNLNLGEPFAKKTIEGQQYFKKATLNLILRKITLIHENMEDETN